MIGASSQAASLWPLGATAGLFLGSFLNVLSRRWRAGKGLGRLDRSRCPHCHHQLSWLELLPVASYVLQSGRCRYCQRRISLRYPVVELGTGALVGSVVASFGLGLQGILLGVLGLGLLLLLLLDLDHGLLPNVVTLPFLGLAAAALVVLGWGNLIQPLPLPLTDLAAWPAGLSLALAGLGGLVVVTRGAGMGVGDVKLGLVIGVSLGGLLTLLALFVAFVAGAVVGVLLIAGRQATLKSAVPFGPFLVLGWLVAVFGGEALLAWYTNLS